jgi:two-component system cell cycle response regulator
VTPTSPSAGPESRELVSVLFIEDNAGDVRVVEEALKESARVRFHLERVDRLVHALARLAKEAYDIILLDLTLPDSWGLDTFLKVREAAPHTPVMVLTGLDDETLGIMAVQQGAQEYLVKGQASGPLILRCLRYALQRHRMQQDLRGLTLTDELTGLFNRRGFTVLSRQLLKLCGRMTRPVVLLFAEIDGSRAGDETLRQVGTLMRRSFRDSDVLARLDGGSFAVLAIDVPDERGLAARLEETLKDFNAVRGQGEPALRLTVGALRFDPDASVSIEDLLDQAGGLRGGYPAAP